MRIAVDLTTCENHGQCTFVAPDVFSLNDDGELSFREHAATEYVSETISDEHRDNVEDAIGMCPVQAIRETTGEG